MPHQLAAHAPPLRTLAAHDETDARRLFAARCERRANFRALLLAGDGSSSCNQLRRRCGDDRQPVRMMIAPRAERVSEIRQSGEVPLALACSSSQRSSSQRDRASASSERAESTIGHGAFGWASGVLGWLMRRRLGQNDVRIGAAKSKRVDAHHPLAVRLGEWLQLRGHPQLQPSKSMCGLGVSK